jgi:hypothetical protein
VILLLFVLHLFVFVFVLHLFVFVCVLLLFVFEFVAFVDEEATDKHHYSAVEKGEVVAIGEDPLFEVLYVCDEVHCIISNNVTLFNGHVELNEFAVGSCTNDVVCGFTVFFN